MKTILHTSIAVAAFALALVPSIGRAQIFNGDNNNNFVQQNSGDQSVRDFTFNFLGGNDRLILLRNDDLAGLNRGVANMGDGRDVVLTSFNMSGTFNLGNGNDFFLSEGDVNFNANGTDILVQAGTGNDLILVTTDFCIYRGEQGNDIFVSDGSRNTFDGGADNDTYSAEAAELGAHIDLGLGFAEARFTTGESLISIENARGSAFNDTLFGDNNANRLDGLAGNDGIDGDPGNDTINGGTGINTLEGNTGTDTLVVQGTITSKTRVSATRIRVRGTFNGLAFDHTASNFEQVLDNDVLKSAAFFMGETNNNTVQQTQIAESPVEAAINGFISGQTLNGTTAGNTLNGAAGFDDIDGLAGNDTLNGNDGDDALFGGAGVDTLNGGNGIDTLDGGAQNDTLNGGLGKDTLTGGANNDIFAFTTALAGNADTITDYNVSQDTIHISRSLVGNLPAGALAAIRFKRTSLGALDADDRLIYNSANGQLLFDSDGSGPVAGVLIATLPANLLMVASEIVLR
jgi:serralysin